MSTPHYLDPTLPAEHRADDLLSRMTLAEKAGQAFHTAASLPEDGELTEKDAVATATRLIRDKHLSHFNVFNGQRAAEIAEWTNRMQDIAAGTRLGIPVTLSSDPRSGFRSSPFTGQSLDTLSRWPEHTGLAATGDIDLVREYADTVRQEFLAMGLRVYLGPMADLFTEPRWSRGFGTFGEDPATAAAMTAAFIEGLRGTKELGAHSVAAVVKHFPGGGPQLGGHDAHDKRHREQVYPGHHQADHLRPFEAAFAAGVTQVMPYYGMPIGTDWDEVGFAFNRPVIHDLLRGHYGFQGIVVTDWNLIEGTTVAGVPFGPNGYGLEDIPPADRVLAALTVGVDQFGGDQCPELIVELVESGRLSMERLDASVRRILLEKFRLGLFENRFVEVDTARAVGADPGFHARGDAAQAASLTLLKDDGRALPLHAGTRVFADGIELADSAVPLTRVATPADADVIIVRLEAPWVSDPESVLGDFFHEGSLAFDDETVQRIATYAESAPVVLSVYLERPAILTDLAPHVSALIGDYGAGDDILLAALTGRAPFSGRLPFDLPRSMAAVEAHREDVPFDTADPLFRFGDGIVRTPASAATAPHGD